MARVPVSPMRAHARVLLLAMLIAFALTQAARAQLSELANTSSHQPASRDQPVTFTADSVEYDRENSLVIAQGHVEAWQSDNVLRADRITFDRNTGAGVELYRNTARYITVSGLEVGACSELPPLDAFIVPWCSSLAKVTFPQAYVP